MPEDCSGCVRSKHYPAKCGDCASWLIIALATERAAHEALKKRVAEGVEVWLTTNRNGFEKVFSEKPTLDATGCWKGEIGIPDELWPNSGECRRVLIVLEKEEL